MKVNQIMHSPAVATTASASARQVATELVFHRFSGMPVDDAQGHIVGIVTEADILKALLEGKDLDAITVDDIMTRRPKTVEESDEVEEVLELLNDHRIVRIPVTRAGKLVGIVSRIDLIRAALHEDFRGF